MKANTKKTIAYLNRPKSIDAIIQNRLIEKQMLKDIALGVTAQSGGERVQSSGSGQKMASAIDKMIDLEREINGLIDYYINTKEEVNGIIEQLPTAQYDVLHKVYIQNMTFDDVAAAKCRSKSWVATIHGRALASVRTILDEQGENNG